MNPYLKSNIYHLNSRISLTAESQPLTAFMQQTLQQHTPAPLLQKPNVTKYLSDIVDYDDISANLVIFRNVTPVLAINFLCLPSKIYHLVSPYEPSTTHRRCRRRRSLLPPPGLAQS